jgi:hypothetical protein
LRHVLINYLAAALLNFSLLWIESQPYARIRRAQRLPAVVRVYEGATVDIQAGERSGDLLIGLMLGEYHHLSLRQHPLQSLGRLACLDRLEPPVSVLN